MRGLGITSLHHARPASKLVLPHTLAKKRRRPTIEVKPASLSALGEPKMHAATTSLWLVGFSTSSASTQPCGGGRACVSRRTDPTPAEV